MGIIDRIKSIFRPFLYGCFFGVLIMYGGLFADRLGFVDMFMDVLADVGAIRPDVDGSGVQSSQTTCGGGGNFDCLNEVVTDPAAPSTGGDYLTFAWKDVDFYQVGTLTGVSSVSQIDLKLYHKENKNNMQIQVSLWDSTETTQYGGSVNMTYRSVSQWDTASFSGTGFPLSQAQLDGLRVRTECLRTSGGSASTCDVYALYNDVTYTPVIDVIVGTTSSQQNLEIGTTTAYVGGTFTILENTSSRNITDITITENGTVDALNDLDNIKLFYKIDNDSPYDCANYKHSATSTQFGATDTTGFSAANGTSTFTEGTGPVISTTATMCAYVVLDVLSSATIAETIEIEISDPSNDVAGSGSPVVSPSTVIALGDTTLLTAQDLTQTHYHWRNDDNTNETDSTSATGGSEDEIFDSFPRSTTKRLRVEVSNEGNQSSESTAYRLEFATKVTDCSVATPWTDVGAVGGDWDMAGSGSLLIEGNNTTNIALGIGGVTDGSGTFIGTSGQKETSSQTSSLILAATDYYEMEYAVVANGSAGDGATYCFRVTNAGTDIDNYTVYPEATIGADLMVSATGTQVSTINIPTAGVYNGGGFVIVDTTPGAHTITDITITASGTVDLQNDIDNIKLWYETDTTSPYDCTGESFDGDETQFGLTDTDGFSLNGTSTFSGSTTTDPTKGVCLYIEYDVGSGATDGELIEIRLLDPSTDIVIDSGSISPASLVDISGITSLITENVVQAHYHWRDNLGTESSAGSLTSGNEDVLFEGLAMNTTARIRFGVQNTGGASTGAMQYRIEWAQKISSCSAATGWTDVDTANDEFTMVASQLVNNTDTTDVTESTGGVSNDGYTFLSTNAGQKESSSQTNNITLPSNNIAELEYSIQATASTTEGASYCFRVTDAGTELDSYSVYPETNIRLGTDFVVMRGVTTLTTGTTVAITEGPAGDYDLQLDDASRAFIRITNTGHTGAGPASTGNHNASDVTTYISNPGNITSGITFTRSGTTGGTRIAWEVIEYIGDAGGENEIIVRSATTATYAAANTTLTTGTVSGIVDDADVVPWITGQGNPDTGRFDYNTGISTSAWNAGGDTVTFTRGEAGSDAVNISYAVIEFTGSNWIIQRSSHTYTSAGTPESDTSISPVNSISRAFLHVQKSVGSGEDQHADFGHEVYLSGIGTVQYLLAGGAQTPALHTSVAWIIENTQNTGNTMKVERSNGTISSGGVAPTIANVDIGKTLNDVSCASIFTVNRADGTSRDFQEPIISVALTSSTTQYELWVGDNSDNIDYRTEVVEWPTAASKPVQNYYRLYEDNDLQTPTVVWSGLAENAEMTGSDNPIAIGESIRIRMSLNITAAALPAGVDAFELEYAARPDAVTCSSLSEASWFKLGDISSTTALWRGNGGTPADGSTLTSTVLSVSDIFGTYEEENDTSLTPVTAFVGDDIEFDWNIEDNAAADKTDYCFRMTNGDTTPLETYTNYPVIRTVGYGPVVGDWKWFDDETNVTPTTQLAGTNTAPIDVANDNLIKLRTVVSEKSGAGGTDVKFKVQFSESSDFSSGVHDVVSSTTCALNATTTSALWCYADGAGIDNVAVDDNTLSTADSCSAGVGAGCGSHNESLSSTTATIDQAALSNMEFEFTLENQGARANAVYYFRLYDVNSYEAVVASSTYPSLVVKGAELVFTLEGVTSGTISEGVTSDVTTTPTSIPFGSLPLDTEYEAIYRLNINSSATQGFQVLMFARQALLNIYAEPVPSVTGSNAAPSGWSTGCTGVAIGCFGYHAGDDTLDGGSTRFMANDTYAAFDTTPQEIMYSSVPANESSDIVYKIQISDQQPAGDYETEIVYLAIPVF